MLLAAAAVTVGAAACSGGGADQPVGHAPARTSSAAPERMTSAPPEFTGVRHKLPTGKALANDPDLYKTVAMRTCHRTDSGWQASGTATNRGKKAVTYRVLVFFTDAQARAIDSANGTVTVKSGQRATWHASRKFKAGKVSCVVRAVRAQDA
jgi:hypothetical protein